jgi:hypothetical protein
MDDEPDACQTYELRLWRAKGQGKWQWRASIERLHTGERHAFASLEQLFAYWSEQCERQVPDLPGTCPAPGLPLDTVLSQRTPSSGTERDKCEFAKDYWTPPGE